MKKGRHQQAIAPHHRWVIAGVFGVVAVLLAGVMIATVATQRANRSAERTSSASAPDQSINRKRQSASAAASDATASSTGKYAVKLSDDMTFLLPNGGVNAPQVITLTATSNTQYRVTLNQLQPPVMNARTHERPTPLQVYQAKTVTGTVSSIATKTVTVFSASPAGSTRQVRVNTKLTLTQHYQGGNDTKPDVFYFFYNQDGGMSLAAPNYAGNVSAAQQHDLAEYLAGSDRAVVTRLLLHRGFSLSPHLYNGEEVDRAMDEQKAPQNTVHDGVLLGYFNSASTTRLTGLGSYVGAWDGTYQVTATRLIFFSRGKVVHSFPYTLRDGVLTIKDDRMTDAHGNVLTTQFAFDDDAQALTDGKVAQH